MITIKSIVLAEDDEDDVYVFRDAVKTVLPTATLQTVRNGYELLKLLENFLPDLLFLDLDMPVKKGLGCLLHIRSHPRLRDLPRIVFSSTSRPENVQTAYEMGAHLYLAKTGSYRQHICRIEALLGLDWEHPQKVKEKYVTNGQYTAFM